MCFLKHAWSNWKLYPASMLSGVLIWRGGSRKRNINIVEYRICLTCDKMELRVKD